MEDGDFARPPRGQDGVEGKNSLRLVKGVNVAVSETACGLVLTVDQIAKVTDSAVPRSLRVASRVAARRVSSRDASSSARRAMSTDHCVCV